MKHFYSHLVQLEAVFIELEELNLSDEEKNHLGKLIDSNLHHTILDAVLTELELEDKETFLRLVSENKHDTIWQHLNAKIDSIEQKIKQTAQDMTIQIQQDIKNAKHQKGGMRK